MEYRSTPSSCSSTDRVPLSTAISVVFSCFWSSGRILNKYIAKQRILHVVASGPSTLGEPLFREYSIAIYLGCSRCVLWKRVKLTFAINLTRYSSWLKVLFILFCLEIDKRRFFWRWSVDSRSSKNSTYTRNHRSRTLWFCVPYCSKQLAVVWT